MKTLLARWSWIRVVEGILLIILGLLVAILGGIDPHGLTKALSIVIAIFLFLDGGITLFGYVINPQKNFSLECVISALFIAFGVILCTEGGQTSLGNIISTFAIAVLFSVSFAFLVKGIFTILYKGPTGWIVLNFLIFAITLALGILSIIYKEKHVNQIIYITLGSGILVVGVFDIILAVKAIKEGKAPASINAPSVKVVEVDATRKDDESFNGYIGKTKEIKKLPNKKGAVKKLKS